VRAKSRGESIRYPVGEAVERVVVVIGRVSAGGDDRGDHACPHGSVSRGIGRAAASHVATPAKVSSHPGGTIPTCAISRHRSGGPRAPPRRDVR